MSIDLTSLIPTGYACNENPIVTSQPATTEKKVKPNSTKVKDENTTYIHRRTEIGGGGFKTTRLGTMVTKDNTVDIVYQKAKKYQGLPLITNQDLLDEVAVQKNCAHGNVVKIYDCIRYPEKDKIVLYLEKCDKDLKTAIQEKSLDFHQKLQVVQDVASALIAIHAKGYGHNDIKCDNILLKDGRGKVTDFGLAKKLGEKLVFKSLDILPPEHKQVKRPLSSEKADVYQFGLLLWNTFHNNPVAEHFTRGFVYPTTDTTSTHDSRIQKLMNECLKQDPQERPTMKQVAENLSMCE